MKGMMTDSPSMNQVRVGRNDVLDILLVGRDRTETERLADSFEKTAVNTTLHPVRSGRAALDGLYRGGDASVPSPDIVLVDLPPRDALEFLEALDGEHRFAYTPVLVVVDGSVDVGRYYERGVNACLERAGEYDGLVSAIETFWSEQVQLPPK